MTKSKARFIVDSEGRITDRKSDNERESYAERFREYNSEENRAKRLKEKYPDYDPNDPLTLITPKDREKFMWETYRQSVDEPMFRVGAFIGFLGLCSLAKASASPDGFGWLGWGGIGVTLLAVTGLMMLWVVIVTFHDP